MDEGARSPVAVGRSMMGVLREDRRHSENGLPRDPAFLGSLPLDVGDQRPNFLPNLLGRRGAPAGQGRQSDDFAGSKLPEGGFFRPTSSVLESAIVPSPFEGLAMGEGVGTVNPGPIKRALHQKFLRTLGQKVTQAVHLGLLLVGNSDRFVPAAPELVLPADRAAHFPRDVRVDIPHEACELQPIADGEEKVVVVGEEGQSVDLDAEPPLRASQDAEDEVADLGRGFQEKPALEGLAGDFDEGAEWEKA